MQYTNNLLKTCLLLSALMLSTLSVARAATEDAAAQPLKITETFDDKLPKVCQDKLIYLVKDLVGPKKHRVLRHALDNKSYRAFILLQYNDQDSHVNLTAVPDGDDCLVSYTESFELDAPCTEARDSLFKRWALLGQLSDTSFFLRYDFPRKKETLPANEADRKMAVMTQTRHGKGCLITRKQNNVVYVGGEQDEK